jgi:hypothetical protein
MYGQRGDMPVLSGFSPAELYRQLTSQGSASTFNRLLRSRHVADLRVIFLVAFFVGVAIVAEGVWAVVNGRSDALTYILAVMAASGAVMAWAYQTGGMRLGIVDIFACEIATLCRVGTIVDLVPRLVATFDALATADAAPAADKPTQRVIHDFDPHESYEPVFDNNARDLQVLDALVVTNVTQFYTYAKAMRDYWRQLSQAKSLDQRQTVLTSVLYMHFLALESARFAIAELIEFEPNEADTTLVILLSELPAFAFLLKRFEPKEGQKGDLRYRRLHLRVEAYKATIPDMCCRILHSEDEVWGKLQETAGDVARCYEAAFGESIEATTSCEQRVLRMRAQQTKGRRSLGAYAGGVTPGR